MSASYSQTVASMTNLFNAGFAKSMGQSTGMSTGGTMMSMMKSSLMPSGTNSGFMTNPNNPLQGVSALSGIGNFASNIEAMGMARQMGFLPSTQQGGGMMSGFGQMGGMMMPTSSDPMQQLASMLMSMIGMLGGGGQQTASYGGYGQMSGYGQTAGFGTGFGQTGFGQTGFGQTGFGNSNSMFTGVNSFAGIDAGINYGLSGVANTLSLIGLSV